MRVVVVTMFEIDADSGDKPGEFQLWKERRHLTETIQFRKVGTIWPMILKRASLRS